MTETTMHTKYTTRKKQKKKRGGIERSEVGEKLIIIMGRGHLLHLGSRGGRECDLCLSRSYVSSPPGEPGKWRSREGDKGKASEIGEKIAVYQDQKTDGQIHSGGLRREKKIGVVEDD